MPFWFLQWSTNLVLYSNETFNLISRCFILERKNNFFIQNIVHYSQLFITQWVENDTKSNYSFIFRCIKKKSLSTLFPILVHLWWVSNNATLLAEFPVNLSIKLTKISISSLQLFSGYQSKHFRQYLKLGQRLEWMAALWLENTFKLSFTGSTVVQGNILSFQIAGKCEQMICIFSVRLSYDNNINWVTWFMKKIRHSVYIIIIGNV